MCLASPVLTSKLAVLKATKSVRVSTTLTQHFLKNLFNLVLKVRPKNDLKKRRLNKLKQSYPSMDLKTEKLTRSAIATFKPFKLLVLPSWKDSEMMKDTEMTWFCWLRLTPKQPKTKTNAKT